MISTFRQVSNLHLHQVLLLRILLWTKLWYACKPFKIKRTFDMLNRLLKRKLDRLLP